MSNAAPPEFQALAELEGVIRHLADELSSWRRRALRAEAERAEATGGKETVSSREKALRMERENRDLKERVDVARTRVQDLVKRLRFLEEQAGAEVPR